MLKQSNPFEEVYDVNSWTELCSYDQANNSYIFFYKKSLWGKSGNVELDSLTSNLFFKSEHPKEASRPTFKTISKLT